MKYLKILSIISFLFVNGLGEHGIPNFAGIPLCLLSFFDDLQVHTFLKISWGLGVVGVLSLAALIGIAFFRQYRDRFLLLACFIALLVIEVYFSGILHHNKIIFWFAFPLSVFITSSVALIIISFKKPKELTIPESEL